MNDEVAVESSIGGKIRELFSLREYRSGLEANAKALKEQEDGIVHDILDEMEDSGTDKITVKGTGTVTREVKIFPSVKDWYAVFSWVADNAKWHLLRKQLNDGAFREEIDLGTQIPACDATPVAKLNCRRSG